MRKKRFSVTGYFRELFRDRKRRKAFLVGLIVFIVVFIGMTAYQHSMEKRQGDVILTNGGNGDEQENPYAGGVAADGENPGAGGAGADGVSSGSNGDSAGGSGADEVGNGSNGDGAGSAGKGPDSAGGGLTGQGIAATPAAIFVDVGGAVRISGLFALPHGSRVADAIEAAGGLTEDADVKYLNRAAVLSDCDRLYIPTAAEVRDGTAPPSAGQVTVSGGYTGGAATGGNDNGTAAGGGNNGAEAGGYNNGAAAGGYSNGGAAGGAGAGQGLININTAGSEELQKLSGVGPATAQKIIDYRTNNGGFGRVEEIMNVSGIGTKTFEKLRAYITV